MADIGPVSGGVALPPAAMQEQGRLLRHARAVKALLPANLFFPLTDFVSIFGVVDLVMSSTQTQLQMFNKMRNFLQDS